MQAAARLVSADKAVALFWLSSGQADVLANEYGEKASPSCVCGTAHAYVEGMGNFGRLQNVIRTGRGLTYDEFGDGMACAICRYLGVWTRHNLAQHIAAIPGATHCWNL
jgi:hypothetical protein